ncbi:SDR family oxidoreductase [Bosea sp. (in: a-proteobacteria)]|uniref:SDR family NAD(P)-dependent oxidoreductase n=1 Tax=Bosea sp. (in: a-proteobacteria) TaxID=1871050 RepID=UPI002629024B|nr:SDR family NAD(P)-dependent oxidoreductase [Bosea sp. (in: a-proteobacteria)]MCO5093311.1 SDR family NAD(P)-dependent oxidoreductase [Bosea sp. (in: a-proteobacteria)]
MALPRMTPQDGIAWITGASSGIGAAVARELAGRGWTVAVTARRLEALERLARAAEDLPGRIVAHAGDVTDAEAMQRVAEAIESIHGPIALAFLNAGIAAGEGRAIDARTVEAVVAVNLVGVAKSFFPVERRMALRGRGQIAVNASLVGYRGLPGAAAYGAAKAGAIYFCEAMRFDCEAAGIRLQLVNPGFIETPMTQGRRFPMPFLLTVEEGARRIVDGFERGGFEITVPRRLAWILKVARLLPYPAYFALMARFAERGG